MKIAFWRAYIRVQKSLSRDALVLQRGWAIFTLICITLRVCNMEPTQSLRTWWASSHKRLSRGRSMSSQFNVRVLSFRLVSISWADAENWWQEKLRAQNWLLGRLLLSSIMLSTSLCHEFNFGGPSGRFALSVTCHFRMRLRWNFIAINDSGKSYLILSNTNLPVVLYCEGLQTGFSRYVKLWCECY